MAAVLSLDTPFQIRWQRSGGMISGELRCSRQIRDPWTNRRAIINSTIEATSVTNWADCLVSSSITALVPSPYLPLLSYQAKEAPVLTLWARFFQLCPQRRARCYCLPLWRNRSARLLTLWAGVKCPNASLTNVLCNSSNAVALWTCH